MLTTKIRELADAKAQVAALENEIVRELPKELAALPKIYGFADARSFMAAVAGVGKAVPTAKKQRRRRSKITDEMRAELKKLVEAGKTGAEIARALKISLPS